MWGVYCGTTLPATSAQEDQSDAAAYQELRRERVEYIVRMSRRNGSQKRASGRLALFLRDLILPWVIPLGVRAGHKVQRYRADLEVLDRPVM